MTNERRKVLVGMRVKGKVSRIALLLAFAALAVGAIAGSASASRLGPAKAQRHIYSFRFAVAVAVADPGQVFLYAPEGFGYFKAEGLDVKPLFNAGGGAALAEVAAGAADFGLSSPENLWNGIAAGEPIRGFATVLTNSIYHQGVGVLSDSPIKSYDDLKGKKIGVSSFTSGSFPHAQEDLAAHGLDPKKDVTIVPIGNSGAAAASIQKGSVDAAVTTETQWAIFKALGLNIRFLPATPEVDNLPADVLFATSDTLAKYPTFAARFARAVMEGTVAALANPNKALDYYYQYYPEEAAALTRAQNMAIMKARLEDMVLTKSQKGRWGYMPIGDYNQVQKLGLQYGVVKKEQNISQLFTNSMTKIINRFDPKKVAARAKKLGK